MYRLIEAYLAFSGVTKREIAQSLNISYNTLLLKLKGSSPFTLDEAVALHRLLDARETVEELLEQTEKVS